MQISGFSQINIDQPPFLDFSCSSVLETLTIAKNVVWEPEQESVGDQFSEEQGHGVLNNTLHACSDGTNCV